MKRHAKTIFLDRHDNPFLTNLLSMVNLQHNMNDIKMIKLERFFSDHSDRIEINGEVIKPIYEYEAHYITKKDGMMCCYAFSEFLNKGLIDRDSIKLKNSFTLSLYLNKPEVEKYLSQIMESNVFRHDKSIEENLFYMITHS